MKGAKAGGTPSKETSKKVKKVTKAKHIAEGLGDESDDSNKGKKSSRKAAESSEIDEEEEMEEEEAGEGEEEEVEELQGKDGKKAAPATTGGSASEKGDSHSLTIHSSTITSGSPKTGSPKTGSSEIVKKLKSKLKQGDVDPMLLVEMLLKDRDSRMQEKPVVRTQSGKDTGRVFGPQIADRSPLRRSSRWRKFSSFTTCPRTYLARRKVTQE